MVGHGREFAWAPLGARPSMSSRGAPAVLEEPGGETGSLNGGNHATDRDASASWVQGGTQVSRLAVVAIAIKPSSESDDVCARQSAGLPAGHLDWQPEPMRRLPPIAKERDGGCANVNTSGGAHAMHTHANNCLNDVCCVQTSTGADRIDPCDTKTPLAVTRPLVNELTACNADPEVTTISTELRRLSRLAAASHEFEPECGGKVQREFQSRVHRLRRNRGRAALGRAVSRGRTFEGSP